MEVEQRVSNVDTTMSQTPENLNDLANNKGVMASGHGNSSRPNEVNQDHLVNLDSSVATENLVIKESDSKTINDKETKGKYGKPLVQADQEVVLTDDDILEDDLDDSQNNIDSKNIDNKVPEKSKLNKNDSTNRSIPKVNIKASELYSKSDKLSSSNRGSSHNETNANEAKVSKTSCESKRKSSENAETDKRVSNTSCDDRKSSKGETNATEPKVSKTSCESRNSSNGEPTETISSRKVIIGKAEDITNTVDDSESEHSVAGLKENFVTDNNSVDLTNRSHNKLESRFKRQQKCASQKHEKEQYDVQDQRSDKNFDLSGLENFKMKEYNSLMDYSLKRFFCEPEKIKHMTKIGLITKEGLVIRNPDLEFKKKSSCIALRNNVSKSKENKVGNQNVKLNRSTVSSKDIQKVEKNKKLKKKRSPLGKILFKNAKPKSKSKSKINKKIHKKQYEDFLSHIEEIYNIK